MPTFVSYEVDGVNKPSDQPIHPLLSAILGMVASGADAAELRAPRFEEAAVQVANDAPVSIEIRLDR